ncbi:MAG: glycosyltransferase family 39 protein, partial [Victivallales bacterium]|nr:glycosyltransferase family 39 protein [Victivallales bacterium]
QRYATWSEGFLTQSTRAPLYPLMIASSYLASGSRAFIVPKILNLVLDMLAILAVFILARKLFGIRAALCSSGLYAVLGHAVNYMLISSPHTLAVLLTLLIACSLTSLKDRYVPATLLLTLFYALLIHTRPVFMIALPFLIPAIYLQLSDFNRKTDTSEADGENHQSTASASSRPIRNFLAFARADYRSKCWKTLLPVFLIAMLCIPWEVRNYRIHKTVVPVCTIAGWHIASNGSFNMKLSLKFLTSHIYAPDHRAYSEGDFFALSRRMFFDSYLEHPFKLPFFGFIRLVRSWSPPLPWLRFFLPRAYVFPIQISNNAILPLPDFEGMIYLFIFANLAVFAFRRRFGKKVATAVARVFREFRGILILMAGYSLTHIIGIPLIAYRFIMEPLCLVFAVALMLEYWRIFREHRNSAKFAKGSDDAVSAPFVNINGGEITILAILALFFNLFLMLPAFHEPIPKHFNYSR